MAAYNSNYYLSGRYGGVLTPPLSLSTSLPYDLQTTRANRFGGGGLLSDRLLSPLTYNQPTRRFNNNNNNSLTGPSTYSDSLLYDDYGLSDETDLILRNRLSLINKQNNAVVSQSNSNKKQKQAPPLPPSNKQANTTFIKQYNGNNNNNNNINSAATDDDILTNKIDRRITKIPTSKLVKPTVGNKNHSRMSNNNSNNSRIQQKQAQYQNNNFIDENEYNPTPRQQQQQQQQQLKQQQVPKRNNFDNQPLGSSNNEKPIMRRENHIVDSQRNSQESLQRQEDENENDDDDYQLNGDGAAYSNNNPDNKQQQQPQQQQQQMFIYREIAKDGFNVNNNQQNGGSADIDITTVSSMLSSQNQSPDGKPIDSKRQTPFGSKGSKNSKKSFKNGSVISKDTQATTPRSNLRELNLNLDLLNSNNNNGELNSQYRKYDDVRGDTSMSKIQYYREDSSETMYKRESISRIKPIIVRGDVAYGKDSLLPETNRQKAEKEDKRKSYGTLVQRRNNQLTLNGGDRSNQVYSVNDKKSNTKFEQRQVYSRLVKEINDDEFFKKQQNEVLKQILPQIEKRGENLVKQKKQKLQKIKKKSEYSEYVKDRNQVLIDDQRRQRELKSRAKLISEVTEKGYGSYAVKYGTENGYSKSRKQSYFVDLKDNSSKPNYENDFELENSYKSIYNANRYNPTLTYDDDFIV